MNSGAEVDLSGVLGFLKIALSAGLGSAAFQGLLALYREWNEKDHRATYLALRLAVIMESYVLSVAELYFYNANAPEPHDQPYPEWNAQLPKIADYPEDVEGWRSLDRKLSSQCLNLPNKIAGSQRMIDAHTEYGFEDDLILILNEECANRGIEAAQIAELLRKKYNLGLPEWIFDYPSTLREVLSTTMASKRQKELRQEAMVKDFSSRSLP